MKNTYFLFALFLGLFGGLLTATLAQAAPIPGTSSSAMMAPKLGVYRSPIGYEIKTAGSGFKQIAIPADNKFIETVYRHVASEKSKDGNGTLTVRVDKLEKSTPLKKYVSRWQREYPKYGFDLLGSKAFTQNKTQGYVIDLLNKKNNRQLRQVIFMNEAKKSAVILTCRDNTKNFQSTLKGCNEVIRSFNWKRTS